VECCIIIPARLASSRLPRKLLLSETGKSLLQHTYEAADQSTRAGATYVAADGDEIANEVRRFGGNVVLTDPALPSGTDRVAAVARQLPGVELVVNVQGDEPEISPQGIDQLIELIENSPTADMATLATPIRDRRVLQNPDCVKVVLGQLGQAIYFSRCPIPYVRDGDAKGITHLLHLGIYAYRRNFLLKMAEMPPAELEQAEKLEQLRVLSAGHTIMVGIVEEPTIGIDTPEDYQAFVQRYGRASEA